MLSQNPCHAATVINYHAKNYYTVLKAFFSAVNAV